MTCCAKRFRKQTFAVKRTSPSWGYFDGQQWPEQRYPLRLEEKYGVCHELRPASAGVWPRAKVRRPRVLSRRSQSSACFSASNPSLPALTPPQLTMLSRASQRTAHVWKNLQPSNWNTARELDANMPGAGARAGREARFAITMRPINYHAKYGLTWACAGRKHLIWR